MLLELEKLKFKGIGRFLEEQVIDFTSLGKFVQLGGQNNNTKGSSGAGKSTVFMVLDYLFGVSNRPSTVLKCRYSEEGIFVEGTFRYGGKPLTITRGKKLSIDLDGVVTTGNSDKTEEKLDEIIGMPRDLFRKMLHKRQKEGGFFLDMTPAIMDSFLMSALGLNAYKPKIKIADDKVSELTEKKKTTITSLAAARSALKATQDAILSMGLPPVREMHQSVVLDLREKVEKSTGALDLTLQMTRLEEATLNESRPQITSIPFDRTALELLERDYKAAESRITHANWQEKDRQNRAMVELTQFQKHLTRLQTSIAQGEAATKKAVEVAEQIKKIKDGKCYTCGHDWVDAQTHTNLMSSIKNLRIQIEAGQEAHKRIPDAQASVDHWSKEIEPLPVNTDTDTIALQRTEFDLIDLRQQEKDHQWAQLKKNKELLSTFELQESAMRTRHREMLDQVRGQADIDRRTYEAALEKLKSYAAALARYEAQSASLKAQEASYEDRINELLEQSTQVDKELVKAEELKRALKSYLSCSFDEALETISENATKLIRNIPNMANATIQLEGVKETQDGKIKEEVNAVIHMDGDANVPIKSLCGGERTSTDLAIDLSVIDLLESKANKGINLFILDEPFDGLDTVCIEMALEVLKNSNSNKRLIIVDHNPEVKEMVESRLTVVRDGSTSRIVQAA